MSAEDCPISEATRRRVRQTARELGYRANWQAQSLSRGRTYAIGLVYEGNLPFLDGVYNEMLGSFVQSLRDAGYHLQLVPVDHQESWKEALLGRRVDGCAMLHSAPDDLLDTVAELGIPTVLLNMDRGRGLPAICPDDEQGGRLAGRHLLELGHQRIAMYVDTSETPHFSIAARRRGLEQAIEQAGARELVMIEDNCEDAMAVLRDTSHDITAVVCYSQYEATSLLSRLWTAGVSVPRDMSLMCFNDEFPLADLIPPVTTVAVPSAEMGWRGAEMLLGCIGAESSGDQPGDAPRPVVLQEQLITRSSTAPPRSPS